MQVPTPGLMRGQLRCTRRCASAHAGCSQLVFTRSVVRYMKRHPHAIERQLAQGISTLSVDWGAWDSAGMAARAGLARMERLGIGAIAPMEGLAAMGRLLSRCHAGWPCSQVIACVMLWDRYAGCTRRLPEPGSHRACCIGAVHADIQQAYSSTYGSLRALNALCLFRHQHAQSFYGDFKSSTQPQPAQGGPQSEALFSSAPFAMASFDIAQRVAAAVRTVLGADVGPEEPLVAVGLDSLGVLTNLTTKAGYLQRLVSFPACSLPRGCMCQARWSCATSCLAYSPLTCPEPWFTIIPRPPPLPLYSAPGLCLHLSNLRAKLQGDLHGAVVNTDITTIDSMKNTACLLPLQGVLGSMRSCQHTCYLHGLHSSARGRWPPTQSRLSLQHALGCCWACSIGSLGR